LTNEVFHNFVTEKYKVFCLSIEQPEAEKVKNILKLEHFPIFAIVVFPTAF